MHFVSKLSDKQNNSSITNSFGPNTRPPQAQLCKYELKKLPKQSTVAYRLVFFSTFLMTPSLDNLHVL